MESSRPEVRDGQPLIHRPLRFGTFLAPNLFGVYEFITRYAAEKLGVPTELFVGTSYDQVLNQVDVAFLCGLPYVELAARSDPPVEPLAAPVLQGARYGGRPVYFSDVIVHRDGPFRSFADLRGCTWSYNEPHSHSGYGLTRYHLWRLGETDGYFGKVVEAGWHERSIRLVCSGEADASAIDSHVLAVEARDHPELFARLRVVETLGPSTIQPVVAARRLPDWLKADLLQVLLSLGDDPVARDCLHRSCVERFVPVTDAAYDDIREMLAAVESAEFLAIR
jgi:phosphonate transport system substrate-binding protein